MSPAQRRLAIGGAIAALLIAAAVVFARGKPVETRQPFEFNHKIHIDAEVDCLQCHEGLFDRSQPRVPPRETCEQCHFDDPGDNVQLQKLAALIEKGQELDWDPQYRLPDHVFFSHVRHVEVAELKCTQCHGDMPGRTSPPLYRRYMSMADCIDCHADHQDKSKSAKRAVTDCASCHR